MPLAANRRNAATRPARCVHDEIRTLRLEKMVASCRNLVAIGEEELRRLDAGEYGTPKHREHTARELEIHRGWLADLLAEAAPLALAAE